MPRIRWNTRAKISTLALGLKSDVDRASIPNMVAPGEEIELSAAMLKALEKLHGGQFEVVKKTDPAEKAEKGKK